MKKLFASILLVLLSFIGNAQILDPVSWKTSVEKKSDTEFVLVLDATIEHEWHMFSQFTPDEASLPTVIQYKNAKGNYTLVGKTKESPYKKVYSDIFEVDEYLFENKAQFRQTIKITNPKVTSAKVYIEYQVCKEACIQQDKTFDIKLPISSIEESKAEKSVVKDTLVKDTSEVIAVPLITDENRPVGLKSEEINQKLYGLNVSDVKQIQSTSDTKENEVITEKSSLWKIFGLGFIGGLLALLTPCVFPMIPLTVSFFTKSSGSSKSGGIGKALLYGAFILAVYLLLSVPFHLLDSVNPDILNEISTNVWLNIFFFVIFIFFAFSFFGYYELTLPSSWMNKTTQGENIGGVLGIFFMALTLALVSFSCTGPILGSLLAGSLTADGGAWQLTAGMAGFGFALGLPFALFAMFPNMMNSLPKSGGWLNTTKVILGFLELALAFKFLSNADLVKHWGILKIEPFLILWIIIFTGLALYLLGKIKFPHDSPIQKLSTFRIIFGVVTALFVGYLTSGFRVNEETKTFTPLSLLSGLAPPVGYSIFYPNDCPNNLNCFKDLKSGLAYAKEKNKPVLIDFSGYACVNCRKMEEHVWSKPEIDKILRNDVVLISLYVDDKKQLSEEEQLEVIKSDGGTRILENYGHKWAHFQTEFFKSNSQPFYVLFNPKTSEVLNTPVAYMPEASEYKTWLENGIKNFK
ncbi:protein-disulfide reductase DsbD family protein [Flavobacterium terrae]|uniref:Thiol:disulfide interchange protein DsbD n=1 Tax=Flavobacterium terrae TaxID=415425 RepID=A0A1M6EV69_9FLAO|nr:cytochrome c biogenesis protein CcdA [Flavobacterium terrae]SHI89318.1 thiol:disulfide interchange protein DsbD [Flavobacterium terrae]